MDEQETIDRIEQLRSEIDNIDGRLLELLNDRATLSLAVRELKAQIGMSLYVPKREASIVKALQDANEGPLYNENIAEIYDTVLRVMRKL